MEGPTHGEAVARVGIAGISEACKCGLTRRVEGGVLYRLKFKGTEELGLPRDSERMRGADDVR